MLETLSKKHSVTSAQCPWKVFLTIMVGSGTVINHKYIPVMTTLPPAPETPLQLIQCSCSKSACETSWCKCKSNHLFGTDLCNCGAEKDSCKHIASDLYAYDF